MILINLLSLCSPRSRCTTRGYGRFHWPLSRLLCPWGQQPKERAFYTTEVSFSEVPYYRPPATAPSEASQRPSASYLALCPYRGP
jgi:hypothetical protein